MIRICPKCGSIDIGGSSKTYLSDITGVPLIYKCNKCDFSSSVFPLVDVSEVEKIKNKLKKK